MKYRDTYIEYQKTLADSGTEIMDINVALPITEIYIEVRASNHATAPNANSPIARCISSIELVDGSNVLFSLNGQQAMANAAFDIGHFPHRALQDLSGARQLDTWPIRFGRFFGDTIYALDPTKFSNLQLKVTWNLAAVNAIGANGFATGTGRITVIARVMEDAPSPTGLFMTKELYNWTTAASGDERVDLPTDHPYRRIMVRSYESFVGITGVFTNLKLSVDQDKFIPFDLDTGGIVREMENRYGRFRLAQKNYGDDAGTFELWVTEDERGQLTPGASGVICGADYFWKALLKLYMVDHANASQSGKAFFTEVEGLCPENTMAIQMGKPDDPTDWFKAPDFGSIRLYCTQGNAGGNASIFIQQERLYV